MMPMSRLSRCSPSPRVFLPAAARCFSSTKGHLARDKRPFPELPQVRQEFPAASEAFLKAKKDHEELEALCRAGGGQRGVDRHVKKNKKILVRERIKSIIDQVILHLCYPISKIRNYK